MLDEAATKATDASRRTPTRRWRLAQSAFLVLALAVFALATWQVHASESQVVREEVTIGATSGAGEMSALRFTPRGERLNIVAVVAHGYSGSKEVMTTFCAELAKQGITAYCFDFPGHGSSPVVFDTDAALSGAQSQLTETVGAVVDYALQQASRRDAKLVLIGHSMGTSAVGLYALRHPGLANLAATVLVSPTLDEAPTATNPRNLLVLAGDSDPAGIVNIAKMRIAEGCSQPSGDALSADLTCGDPGQGTGRKLVILPGLNHITILTASATHRQILDWLHDGLDAGVTTDTITADQRFLWLLLGLSAALLALLPALALASAGLRQLPTRRVSSTTGNVYVQALMALIVMAVTLVVGMIVLHLFVDSPFGFLRQALAPDLATFLFGAGLVALGVALAVPVYRRGADWPRGFAIAAQVLLAIGALVFLYFTLGALSTSAWANLALTPARLWRAVALATLFIPLFLGCELLLRPLAGALAGAQPWLAAGTKLVVALLTTIALFATILIDAERLSFLLFLLPILAIFLLLFVALETWARREVERPLVVIALSEALILGWAVAATFPLLG
jgi:dienelactone hydrolase